MKEILFATSNPNKVKEVRLLLGNRYAIKSLADINYQDEVPETSGTIEGNAIQKANYIRETLQMDCFAEDTGLEVDALDNRPGVHTAYYAGPERNADANMNLVLTELQGTTNRGAQFRTVVALHLDGQLHTFEGIVRGSIALGKTGSGGFGYDPIFIPDGYNISFAEMEGTVKNQISHRGRAVQKLITFLGNYEF